MNEPEPDTEKANGIESDMVSPNATAVDLPSMLEKASMVDVPKPSSLAPSTDLSPIDEKLPDKPPDLRSHDAKEDVSDKDLEARIPATLAGAEVVGDDDDDDWDYPEGGRGWWVVGGCFIIAAVTLGWPLAWGVFQSYYKEHMFPDTPDALLSLLGSLPGTIMTPTAFVVGKLADRYGYRLFIICGCMAAFLAMITAAFSTQLWQFFITQGILQGFCIGLILPVAMAFPAQWFKKKRGLATGIVIAGSSFGGGFASLVAQQLLNHIGLRYTLLFYAFFHLVLMTCAVFMLKNRPHPHSALFTHAPIEWFDFSLFKLPIFWSVALAIFFTVFGYLPPYFYIETYTMSQLPDLNPALYAVPAAVMNFSAACGRSSIGMLGDRVGVVNAYFGAVFISGLVQLIIWNFAHSFGVIILFSILVGFFGGAFLSLTSVIGAKLFGVSNLATLSGIFMMFNLPGNTAGSPLVGAIYSASGGNWHAPICFSGLSSITGALCILYARFKKQPKVFAVY